MAPQPTSTRSSGPGYWLVLVLSGLLVGAGIALLARPLPERYGWMAAGWVGPACAGLGVLGLILALVGLLRRPGASTGGYDSPKQDLSPAGRKPVKSDQILTPAKSLRAGEVATFLLQELDRCMDLLRHTAGPSDLDRLTSIIGELSQWAGQLAVQRQNLEITARHSKKLLKARAETTSLHMEQLERSGEDAQHAYRTVSDLSPDLPRSEQEALLDQCSKRLTHVSRQFHDRPELRDGLTAIAQAVSTYLGYRKRTIDPTDPALAATLKLPDPSALESVLKEIQAMETAGTPDQDRLEMQRTYLRNIIGAIGPSEGFDSTNTLTEMTRAMRSALSALESNDLPGARQHLSSAIEAMSESDLFKET